MSSSTVIATSVLSSHGAFMIAFATSSLVYRTWRAGADAAALVVPSTALELPR